jgi:hypothetical protein
MITCLFNGDYNLNYLCKCNYCEFWIAKDIKTIDLGLFYVVIPTFAFRDWGKSRIEPSPDSQPLSQGSNQELS